MAQAHNCPCSPECVLQGALNTIGGKWKLPILCSLLGNGASHNAALTYFVKRAIEKVAIPNISRMAVQMVGLTPVLMWGMLLCGYSVVAAVEYQILFLAASFCASVVSMVVTLLIARKYSFDQYNKLK